MLRALKKAKNKVEDSKKEIIQSECKEHVINVSNIAKVCWRTALVSAPLHRWIAGSCRFLFLATHG
jgi:hypothetical protein